MSISTRTQIDLGNTLTAETLQLIHYFVQDTTDKILQHIDRMDIKDTGALRSSIKSTVRFNAGGNSALASFYYINYAPYVEMAVGKYWGIDSDLGKGTGVKAQNIDIPPIQGKLYAPLTATFKGLPAAGNPARARTHRPRPFIMSEIKRQIDRISYRLLEQCANTVQIHMMEAIDDSLMPDVPGNIWEKTGYTQVTGNYIPYSGIAVSNRKSIATI